jgi:hypothetical protein
VIIVAWVLSSLTALMFSLYILGNYFPLTTDKVADGAITEQKLDYWALRVPYAETGEGYDETRLHGYSTEWVDMKDMGINLTVDRSATLFVSFEGRGTGENMSGAYVGVRILMWDPDLSEWKYVLEHYPRASIPVSGFLAEYSFSYLDTIPVYNGTYTIKAQWLVTQEVYVTITAQVRLMALQLRNMS